KLFLARLNSINQKLTVMRTIKTKTKSTTSNFKRNTPLAIYIGTITMITVTYSLVLFFTI
ncbi:MAG: hypothetical protein ACJAX7_000833, partial [Saprospiraceae bacterium]